MSADLVNRLVDVVFVLAIATSVRLFIAAWFVATSPAGSIHWRVWAYPVGCWILWVMVR